MGSKRTEFYKNGGRNSLKADLDEPKLKWQKDGYVTENYEYPKDLFDGKKPLGAYVMFYINVFDSSKVVQDKKVQFVDNNDAIQKRRKNGVIKKIANEGSEAATMLAFVAGAGAIGAIGGLLAGEKPKIDPTAAAAGAAVGLTAIAAIRSQGVSFKKSMKRLKQAIALPMPNEVQIGYSTSYSSESMSDFALASKLGQSVVGTATGAIDAIKNSFGVAQVGDAVGQIMFAPTLKSDGIVNAVDRVANDISSYSGVAAAAALKYLPYGNAISALTGIADNPKTQVTFQGVTPRTFEMSYDLYAHSEEELENIHRIINTFKMNMLPEYKGPEEFLFVYPAEFDIEYYFGAENNKYIHRHTSCVLTDCSINYTPDGVFNHFNKNGAPLKIRMNLRFSELDILTRDDVEAGY